MCSSSTSPLVQLGELTCPARDSGFARSFWSNSCSFDLLASADDSQWLSRSTELKILSKRRLLWEEKGMKSHDVPLIQGTINHARMPNGHRLVRDQRSNDRNIRSFYTISWQKTYSALSHSYKGWLADNSNDETATSTLERQRLGARHSSMQVADSINLWPAYGRFFLVDHLQQKRHRDCVYVALPLARLKTSEEPCASWMANVSFRSFLSNHKCYLRLTDWSKLKTIVAQPDGKPVSHMDGRLVVRFPSRSYKLY